MGSEELKSRRLEPGQSVLEAIERASGRKARVLLRDVPEEHSPVIRVAPKNSEEEVEDNRRYMTLGEIARGGVGIVFKSRDKDLGREVAVKMLRRRFVDTPEVVERFVEEAQITGQLHHPGVVPIYDLGLQPDGRPFFVMKLVKGRTLAALLEERTDATAERRRFLSVFEQVCRTVGYAHARGVIHRDLKPSNIMLGAFGEVQVVDWGFAKVLGLEREGDDRKAPPKMPDMSVIATVRTGEGSSHSIAGSVMGTPAYMPPEQALGQIEQLDERSDVFSLGAILCEILTGKPPYVADADDLLILAAQAKLEDAYARLDACDAHTELVALTKRCLQPLRRDRPDNASEVANGISAHLTAVEERAKLAAVETANERASQREEHARLKREASVAEWERKARRRVLALAATLLVAVLLGGGGYLLAQRDREAQAQRTMIAVREAEDEARLREGQEQWDEATVAAERAMQLAAQPEIDQGTRDRAHSLHARLEQKQQEVAAARKQAERDELLVDRLAEIRAQWLTGRSAERTAGELVVAFRDNDLPIDQPDTPRNILARPIARALVEALDDLYLLVKSDRVRRVIREADPDPWRARVRDSHYRGKVEDLRSLADAQGLARTPVASLALLGHVLIERKQYDDAERVLLGAYHRFPADSRILVRLVDIYRRQKQWNQATRYLTAALALRPSSSALRAQLGLALAHAGDLDTAVMTLEEGKLRGLDLEGYCQLGNVLARKGNRDGAVGAFRQAMREDPRSARPHHQLGVALVQQFKDYEGAIAVFKDALRLDSKSAEIYRSLGIAYDGNNDSKRALESIDEALALKPEYPAARESRGIVLAREHRYHEAIIEFLRATADAPDRGSAHFHLARAYLATGRYPGVLASLDAAYNAGYRSRHVDINRGLAFEALGNNKQAIYHIGKVALADPDFAEAQCHLGRVMFRDGTFKQGVFYTQRGDDAGQEMGDNWKYPSAEQLARMKRVRALADKLQAGESPPASVELAAAHFFAKRYEDAARVYNEIESLPRGQAHLRAAGAALNAARNEELEPKERERRRERAHAWMTAELAYWQPRVIKGDHVAYKTLMDWKEGWILGHADDESVAKFPEEERVAWRKFWSGVEMALAEAEK
ncbi:MAG: protein kinase [Planctomycetota bacterium]